MFTTTQPPKPKRRWYQFSLKTLLVVMLVSCFAFAWIGSRIKQARENRATLAVDQVMVDSFGGFVFRHPSRLERLFDDPGGLESDLTVGISRDNQFTNAGLEHLDGLTNLTSLSLDNTKVTDAGLEHLKGLKDLEDLWLDNTKLSDAGLEHLKGLTKLELLYLRFTKITDAGLEHLNGLTNLEQLNLSATQVSDDGLVHLKGMGSLVYLNLRKTNVTDAGVKQLQEALPNCFIDH